MVCGEWCVLILRSTCPGLPAPTSARHFSHPSSIGDNPLIPLENLENLVDHIVLVHESVDDFSKQFLQKLRRSNYVTPKNYLDFINTYSKLLDEKTQYNIGGPGVIRQGQGVHPVWAGSWPALSICL